MILRCSYEELRALREGARTLLEREPGDPRAVAAASATRAEVEALVPLLDGDVMVRTLEDQQAVEGSVEAIVECLRVEMESNVVALHPAAEGAVAAYFDFAHAFTVLSRIRTIGRDMRGLIEVVTGAPPDEEIASTFVFPD